MFAIFHFKLLFTVQSQMIRIATYAVVFVSRIYFYPFPVNCEHPKSATLGLTKREAAPKLLCLSCAHLALVASISLKKWVLYSRPTPTKSLCGPAVFGKASQTDWMPTVSRSVVDGKLQAMSYHHKFQKPLPSRPSIYIAKYAKASERTGLRNMPEIRQAECIIFP